MYVLKDIWDSLFNVIKTIEVRDILDMALLSYIIFKGIKIIRETRAGQLLKGIVLFIGAYLVCKQLELKAMTFLLENTLNVGLLAIMIMFQPELRRALEKVGRTSVSNMQIFSNSSTDELTQKWETAITAICDACEELSSTTTGALIVIERQTKLGEQIDSGVIMNAEPSKEIFGNIFYPKTPLHDGAVIMRDGMILAAACFLPKPQKEEFINKKLGSRHRAAIGMSENSDAIIIAVSEETGTISIAENGNLERPFNRTTLERYLRNKIIPQQIEEDKPAKQKKVPKRKRREKN